MNWTWLALVARRIGIATVAVPHQGGVVNGKRRIACFEHNMPAIIRYSDAGRF